MYGTIVIENQHHQIILLGDIDGCASAVLSRAAGILDSAVDKSCICNLRITSPTLYTTRLQSHTKNHADIK